MSLKKWQRQAAKNQARAAQQNVTTPAVGEENGRLTVSQGSLDLLQQGLGELQQRRQQMMAALSELDALIQQQRGGISVMEQLLAGQQPAGEGEGAGGE